MRKRRSGRCLVVHVAHPGAHAVRQQDGAPDAFRLQPPGRAADALDRFREHGRVVVVEPGVGFLHGHLDGQRRIAGVRKARAQRADHAVIRMHADAVHEQYRGRSVPRFSQEPEKFPSALPVQPNRFADHQPRNDLRRPALFALVVLRLQRKRQDSHKTKSRPGPYAYQRRPDKKYRGNPTTITANPPTTAMPKLGPYGPRMKSMLEYSMNAQDAQKASGTTG